MNNKKDMEKQNMEEENVDAEQIDRSKDAPQCDISDSKEDYEKTKTKDTATDVYYKTECKLEDSKVAIPTYDSVVEAKTWVDDENKR